MTKQSHPNNVLKKGNVFHDVYVLFSWFNEHLDADDGRDPEIVSADVTPVRRYISRWRFDARNVNDFV